MSDFVFINKARTIAVTGHRVLYEGFDQQKLEKLFKQIINKGFDTFLIGMALGFDTVCFQTLEKLKEKEKIKIIACVPCLTQAYKFNSEQKKEYERMLEVADEKVLISKEYTKNCMQKRNEFMVDNASALLTYLKRDFGGTANTVKYAKKMGVPIIEFE